jgi:tRNA(Leu) C34 or U34 (ribose-2'-O)-methylase TrmL
MKRGFAGIALYEPKLIKNLGTLMRSVHCFGFQFVCTIGERYSRRESADTTDLIKHVPVFHYRNVDEFIHSKPLNAKVIGVEVNGRSSLKDIAHPQQAIYLLGGEDRTLSPEILENVCDHTIRIDTSYCLNQAVCASIIMYDRVAKLG